MPKPSAAPAGRGDGPTPAGQGTARTSRAGTNGAPGSQTLARGLAALQLVAASPGGLTAQQVADDIGVHRTIAYRLLTTLAQYRFVAKGEDGRYRSASALAVLGASFDNNVRQLSLPTLRGLADELGTTVSLLIAEGDQQVAIAVIVPTNGVLPTVVPRGQPLPAGSRGGRNRAAGQHAAAPRRAGPRSSNTQTRLGHHPWRGRTEHLRPCRAGPTEPAVSADVHQPHLPPRGRGHARQRLSHQGGQRIIRDPQLRVRQPKG